MEDEPKNNEPNNGSEENKEIELPKTQSELDSLIGKAVDKALKNNDKKWQKSQDEAIEKAKKEAESYAKMTQAQRKDAEMEKREKELDEREAKLNHKALIADIQADLTEKGLPLSFAESLASLGDNETISQAVSDIKDEWDKSVNERLKKNARQNTPPSSASAFNGSGSQVIADFARENRKIK